MNKMVSTMVDLLFQDVVENEETRAMHEELMDNCQEHFQDLVNGGLTEEEAAEAVMESLSGMQEVIDQYPRKEKAAEEVPVLKVPKENVASETEETDSHGVSMDADDVGKVRIDAGNHGVELFVSDGGCLRVECEDMRTIRVDKADGVLTVQAIRPEETVQTEVEETLDKGKPVMEMTLNELLSKVRGVVEKTVRMVSDHITIMGGEGEMIRVWLPRTLLPELDINASSGDLWIHEAVSPRITLRTASGDIRMDGNRKQMLDHVFVSTASGDVNLSAIWSKKAEISAISGDVEVEGDFGEAALKSVSGDVEFRGTALELATKSISGDVNLDMLEAGETRITAEATSGDVAIDLPDDCGGVHVNFSTVVGETSCSWPDAGENAPVQVLVHTVSGDITIH